jgi:alpha-D-ribose 1-methylphosphonate 5-triphosphate synthase subunit PhnH
MHTANGSSALPAGIDLQTLTLGFADTVHDSQRVFRALLDALSRPGTVVSIDAVLSESRRMPSAPLAAFAALLALADFSTPVFLQHEDAALSDAIRFHTGAPLTLDAGIASFAYLHDAATLPPLDTFSLGEAETPEAAATLFIRVESLTRGVPTVWRGPGIADAREVSIAGLPDSFWKQRAALASQFPRGIDCYFVAGGELIGLPRTTQVEAH